MLGMLGMLGVRVGVLGRVLSDVHGHVRELLHVWMLVVLVGMPRLVLWLVLGRLRRQLRQELLRVRLDVRVGLHVV